MTNSGLRRGLAVRCGVLASGSRCRAFLPGLPGRTRVRRGSARRYRSLPEKQKGRVADAIRPTEIIAKLPLSLQHVFFRATNRSKGPVSTRIEHPQPPKKDKIHRWNLGMPGQRRGRYAGPSSPACRAGPAKNAGAPGATSSDQTGAAVLRPYQESQTEVIFFWGICRRPGLCLWRPGPAGP